MAKVSIQASPIESCSHATFPEATQAKLSGGIDGGPADLPPRDIVQNYRPRQRLSVLRSRTSCCRWRAFGPLSRTKSTRNYYCNAR